ncbi:armadillo-type protein [Pavlovales sp. CCMP2436]|nr:armadillo-type protein [Pavlovales sp. CCMP2436]
MAVLDAASLAQLYSLLIGALSPDGRTRVAAERELAACAVSPGAYMGALTLIASHPQSAPECAQLALVLLRQTVRHGWEAAGEMQPLVRERLPALLGHAVPRVRVAAAVAISAIAATTDPWPGLLTGLCAALRSGDAALCHGALRCLELVVCELDEDELVVAFEQGGLVAKLTCFAEVQPSADALPAGRAVGRRALGVCMAIVQHMSMVVDSNAAGPVYAHAAFARWATLYLAQAGGGGELGLAIGLARLLESLVQTYPRWQLLREEDAPRALLGGAWSVLVRAGATLRAEGSAATGADSDGDELGVEALTLSSLELLATLMEAKPFRPLVRENLGMLFTELVGLLAISEEMAEEWTSDLSAFAEVDQLESLGYSVRVAAAELLQNQLERGGEQALLALLSVARAQLDASGAARAAAGGDAWRWWPQAEAGLFALQLSAPRAHVLTRSDVAAASGFDLGAFLGGALPAAAAAGEPVFARARAFALAGALAERMGAEQHAGWARLCADALADGATKPTAAHVSAARAAAELCQPRADGVELPPAEKERLLLALGEHVGSGALDGDALCVMVEAAGGVLGAKPASPAAAAVAQPLAAALCAALGRSWEPTLWAATLDALEMLLLAGPDAHAAVAVSLLPALGSVLERGDAAARAAAERAADGAAGGGGSDGMDEAEAVTMVARFHALLLRTAPESPAPVWGLLAAHALAFAPRALHELVLALTAATEAAVAATAGGRRAPFAAALRLEAIRASTEVLVAASARGLLDARTEPALADAAVGALAPRVPDKAALAALPLIAELLGAAAAGLADPSAERAAASHALLRALAGTCAARLAAATDTALAQALCVALARLGIALALVRLRAAAGGGHPPAEAAQVDPGQLATQAGEALCALLLALPALPTAGGGCTTAGALPAVLQAWTAFAPLFAGSAARKLSALLLVGALASGGVQLDAITVVAPPRAPSGEGICTRARARERLAADAKAGALQRRLPLSARLLEVILELLREEALLHAADLADARAAAARGVRGGGTGWLAAGAEGDDADDERHRGEDDDECSDEGEGEEEEEDDDDGGAVSLSASLQAESAFAYAADDEVVDGRSTPVEQALAAMALGPFLLAFVHSLAQGALLERCASALGNEDRATLQQTLARAAW